MDVTNGFRRSDDIGGPMDIKAGYRWNVPVVSYGFDRSFLDYFGSNGIAAVEAAINLLNSLPPASALILTNYPVDSGQRNYQAQAQNLFDLKSATLCLLLEHLGLAQPTRYIFALRQWDPILNSFGYLGSGPPWPEGVVPNLIIERNFDPASLASSYFVNNTSYAGLVIYWSLGSNGIPTVADVIEYLVDPLDAAYDAVAENFLSLSTSGVQPAGLFYTGLTYDDIGGLRYLLRTNNVCFESLLPDVFSAGTDEAVVDGAWRPGVDKVTFVRHPFDPQTASFTPLTNEFTDTYATNGQVLHQQLKRVVKQPDFLFSAADTGQGNSWAPYFVRTGTTNWLNNAASNGGTNRAGPGVIAPPINVIFHKLGGWVDSGEPTPEQFSTLTQTYWGSFDQSTNAPVIYPDLRSQTNRPLVLRLRIETGGATSSYLGAFDWQLPIPIGGTALLQSSTNLEDWASINTVTNRGAVIEWFHQGTSQSRRFFRVVPQ